MQSFTSAVNEVKAYIVNHLKDEYLDEETLDRFAVEYVWYGIETSEGRDEMYAEIDGAHSRTKNPVPFSFEAVDHTL